MGAVGVSPRLAKPAEVGRNRAPAAFGHDAQLRLPHPRVERKCVKKNESAAGSDPSARHPFEVVERSGYWHAPIVNVPPPRVESDSPTAIVPTGVETATRSTVVDPRRPIRTVPVPIAP